MVNQSHQLLSKWCSICSFVQEGTGEALPECAPPPQASNLCACLCSHCQKLETLRAAQGPPRCVGGISCFWERKTLVLLTSLPAPQPIVSALIHFNSGQCLCVWICCVPEPST